jgi:hypothetical protein
VKVYRLKLTEVERAELEQLVTKARPAWTRDRNVEHTTIDWHFTTADARIKLKRVYPDIL